MDRIKSLSILLRVVETGSFSRCAKELKVGQSTISKAVGGLEKELGLKILHRTTRNLTLTEEGRQIYIEARKVVDTYDELLSASQLKTAPKGTLRVTCPNALGSLYLIPALRHFMKENPQIAIHLRVTDSYLDLYENDIDVAFRVGELESSQIIARRIGQLPRIAVANRQYLKKYGRPNSLAELDSHSCIVVGRSGASAIWTGNTHDKKPFSVEVKGRIVVDSHLALQTAVSAGFGIGLAASFIFIENGELRKGLEQILGKIEFKPYPVHVLYKEARNLPARARLFIDFFVEDLRKQAWIEN